jgi:hypothetical protein
MPEMGIDGALQMLLQGGFATEAAFGGSGATLIGSLAGNAVYGTLVPAGTSVLPSVQFTSPTSGQTFGASGVSISDGQALYVVPEPSTVAMALMGAFGLLVALRRRRVA